MTTLLVALALLSLLGHGVGAVLLYLCRKESRTRDVATGKRIADAEARLTAFENGATHREMQRFCEHATHIVAEAEDRMDAMRREIAAMAAQAIEGERRLSAALLECAQWEERVQRLLASGRS